MHPSLIKNGNIRVTCRYYLGGENMPEFINRHKSLWSQKSFIWAVAFGLILIGLALLSTYYANYYTEIHAGGPISDIILDNIPVFNVNFIFSEGAIIFIGILAVILLVEPHRLPFTLKAVAIFVIVRSVFITLTHLGPPIHQSYMDTSDLIYKLSSGDDLFFSAHTGLPFLLAMSFWESKWLRYFFLLATVIGGTAVLLGHLHYSIDVFSALFIAYGVFAISRELFRKDYSLFSEGPKP